MRDVLYHKVSKMDSAVTQPFTVYDVTYDPATGFQADAI